jgi:hypothetical protein
MRSTVHRELLDTRRQRDGTANESARATGRVRNVTSRLIKHAVIKGLETNADILRFHVHYTDAKEPKTTASPICSMPVAALEPCVKQQKQRAARITRPERLAAYITS